MIVRDGICAYIAGGLGNQLFILAAARAQAERLGVPLYLDTSNHSARGARPFELDDLNSGAVVLGRSSPWRSMGLPGGRFLPVPRDPRVLRRLFVEKDDSRYDSAINDIRPGTTMLGYFQSERYFASISDRIEEMVVGAPETASESDRIAEFAADPRITVHLRRGDYLHASANRQLIATSAYALRARRVLTALAVDQPLRVFTDSPDLVKEELRGVEGDVQIVENVAGLSPINTIKAMSAGVAFVMSNSSFSWWGAWLMQRRSRQAVVIAPRPWNSSGTARADMLDPGWISLDAR